jgi:hypothetical protein
MKLAEAMTKIVQLEIQVFELHQTNEKLMKEQREFQDELIVKIKEINALGIFKRFMAYGRLLWDLIATIERAISRANR